MNWLERNHITPELCCIVSQCSFCLQKAVCYYSLELEHTKELFCSQRCLDKYCAQMKDMII
jgi:hypothetical protein